MNCEDYTIIRGLPMASLFPEVNVRSAMDYQPSNSDVIIVSYPKCGTTWTQYIVSNIITKGKPPNDPGEFMLHSPFIELFGAESAMNPARRGPIITHLPMNVFPYTKQAKYIYVTRNPYDCCVSKYHFLKGITPKAYEDASFESFVKKFVSGRLLYGDYFDHLLPWYDQRNEANVLFLTYEQLKADTTQWIFNIAEFLGEEHIRALMEDDVLLRSVVEAASLRNMKVVFNYSPHDRVNRMLELPPEKSLKLAEVFKKAPVTHKETHEGCGYVRKGIVGDWKSHFTQEQIKLMKAWIEKKTKGSDVMHLWKDIDLP
nr:sulfotransferase ssu-1-like [Dermacentor andersoni]